MIVSALPTELKSDPASFSRFLRHHAQQRPEYWHSPITNSEAAELLGMSPGALRTARSRGGGPPGYTEIDGRWVYPSRLHVLEWIRIKCNVATGDTDKEAYHA
jgi:hypothetical protein